MIDAYEMLFLFEFIFKLYLLLASLQKPYLRYEGKTENLKELFK